MINISEFYKGKDVFITGATGFMGKVLMEKILRSCSNVGNVYILIRPKKGKDPSTRIKEIVEDPFFELLRQKHPENIKKIIPVLGDCMELGLGLTSTDRHLLIENVSLVFHCAASVRFDDPLKKAILLNTRGTREMFMLAKEMKNLKVIIHFSTAYCNCDRPEVEEIIYPPHGNWRDFINMAENIDEYTLDILCSKLMRNLPNTYVFTKSLAEHVVNDLRGNLPTVIFRPSIVVSTLEDPISGWIDNFNGPIGLTIGAGKGILRTIFSSPHLNTDYVPVDVCIKGVILAAWDKGVSGDSSELSIFNFSNNGMIPITTQQLIDIGLKICDEIPFEDILWYPYTTATDNKWVYYLKVYTQHLIPALIIDELLKCFGKPAMLCKIQRKVFMANMALQFFTTRSWSFSNKNCLALRARTLKEDKKEFFLDHVEDVNPVAHFRNCAIGARKYLLKEHPDTIPQSKKHYRRLYWIDKSLHAILIILVLWILFFLVTKLNF